MVFIGLLADMDKENVVFFNQNILLYPTNVNTTVISSLFKLKKAGEV